MTHRPLKSPVIPLTNDLPPLKEYKLCEWIECEEVNPPFLKEVLVSGEGRVTIGRLTDHYVWLMDEEEFRDGIKEITHWMPLPKPPERR